MLPQLITKRRLFPGGRSDSLSLFLNNIGGEFSARHEPEDNPYSQKEEAHEDVAYEPQFSFDTGIKEF